jgi:hypothetical protein
MYVPKHRLRPFYTSSVFLCSRVLWETPSSRFTCLPTVFPISESEAGHAWCLGSLAGIYVCSTAPLRRPSSLPLATGTWRRIPQSLGTSTQITFLLLSSRCPAPFMPPRSLSCGAPSEATLFVFSVLYCSEDQHGYGAGQNSTRRGGRAQQQFPARSTVLCAVPQPQAQMRPEATEL